MSIPVRRRITVAADVIGQRGERGLRKQAAAYRDPGRTTAIAQHPIVANADEPFGDHMEQEAPDELVDCEGHDCGAVPPAPVAPPEHDVALTEGHQAVIAEGDPMRIAAQVREDMLRGGKGRLGIDDPGLLPQRCKKALEGLRLTQWRCRAGELEPVLRIRPVERAQGICCERRCRAL